MLIKKNKYSFALEPLIRTRGRIPTVSRELSFLWSYIFKQNQEKSKWKNVFLIVWPNFEIEKKRQKGSSAYLKLI